MKNLFYALILFTIAYLPTHAQSPALNYTQNWLDNVSQSTCMQRSKEILEQNNFSVTSQNQVAFGAENKDGKAYLTCQSCGDKTITTIMLSTNLSEAITVELRERMLYYIANGTAKTGAVITKCKWIDGMDNTQPADRGRGVTNWNAHYDAIIANGSGNADEGVKIRMNTLAGCLELDNYAKVYADVSVIIADYGIRFANWTNDLNNTVLGNDVGCGYKDWNAHYNAVNKYGSNNAAEGVKNRLALLSRTLSKDNYAKLYSDVSVIIARYGTTK